MRKVKALITLVIGQANEVPPETVCEVSDEEAKRLIALGFAEAIKIQPQKQPQVKEKANDNDKPHDKSGEQPVSETGNKG